MSTALDQFYPFDSGDGSNSAEDRWAVMARFYRSTGVIPKGEVADLSITNELDVYADNSGMNVKVQSGIIYIQGFIGRNNSTKTINLASSDPTHPRIDVIVARLDRSGADGVIVFDVLTGTPGASPAATELTQTSTVWEEELGRVLVAAASTTTPANSVTITRRTSQSDGKSPIEASGAVSASAGDKYISIGNLVVTLPEGASVGDSITVANTAGNSWTIASNEDAPSQVIYNQANQSAKTSYDAMGLLESIADQAIARLECLQAGDEQIWSVAYGFSCRVLSANYFGDGSDGDVTISSSSNLTSTTDGDMIVLNYASLTIDAGATLSVTNRCKGLLIYVAGDFVLNGTISMTAKGAYVNAEAAGVSATGLRIPMLKSGSVETLSAADFAGAGAAAIAAMANQVGIDANGKIYKIERQGAPGGSGIDGNGVAGSSAANKSGGGGSGSGTNMNGGNGNYGSCFGAGSGGGGGINGSGGQSATAWSGPGGNGGSAGGGYCSGGGAGNPKGAYGDYDGVGGTIIIIVGGDVTIGNLGVISSNGKNGGHGDFCTYGYGGGGGSGGGIVLILHSGSYTNNGSITVNGGIGGVGNSTARPGGTGGAGSIVVGQVN